MADIATIFHWSLASMQEMDPDDLFAWRDRAVVRWNRMQGDRG